MLTNILIFPGIGNSGPAHWQSQWQQVQSANSGFRLERIHQDDWDAPVSSLWVKALEAHIDRLGPNTVIVAHSLACLAVVQWCVSTSLLHNIQGVLLVAVPDPTSEVFPKQATGFDVLPSAALDARCIQLASRNDPYSSLCFSRAVSTAWGTQLVELGALGHINAASGLGDWPEGWTYVRKLAATC